MTLSQKGPMLMKIRTKPLLREGKYVIRLPKHVVDILCLTETTEIEVVIDRVATKKTLPPRW